MEKQLNLFQLMGIDTTETEAKVEKEKKKNVKKTPKKKQGVDVKNGITIISGYYPPLKLERNSFEKDIVDYSDIVSVFSDTHKEYMSDKCKIIPLKEGGRYMVTIDFKQYLSSSKTLHGDFSIRLADFETAISGQNITLEAVEKEWETQYPEFTKNVKYGYDEEQKVIVPILQKTASWAQADAFKNKKISVCLFGRESYTYSDSDVSQQAFSSFAKEHYPELEGHFFLCLSNLEDNGIIVNVVPDASDNKRKKEDMYPTDATVSLAFTRFSLSPDMFGGKTEVTKEELLEKVQEDYGEYTKERTFVEYDKKNQLILLILHSSKKGAISVNSRKDLEKLCKEKEYFIAKYHYNDTFYRVEKTPVGLFAGSADGKENTFVWHLPPIPFKIMNEIYHFFRMVNDCSIQNSEAAVQLFWDIDEARYFIYYPKQMVGAVSVDFQRSHELESKYVLVMDIHSHGALRPYFSSTDNNDERGTRLFCVFGHINQNSYSFQLRAGTGGYFVPLEQEDIFQGMINGLPVVNVEKGTKSRIEKEILKKVIFKEKYC